MGSQHLYFTLSYSYFCHTFHTETKDQFKCPVPRTHKELICQTRYARHDMPEMPWYARVTTSKWQSNVTFGQRYVERVELGASILLSAPDTPDMNNRYAMIRQSQNIKMAIQCNIWQERGNRRLAGFQSPLYSCLIFVSWVKVQSSRLVSNYNDKLKH